MWYIELSRTNEQFASCDPANDRNLWNMEIMKHQRNIHDMLPRKSINANIEKKTRILIDFYSEKLLPTDCETRSAQDAERSFQRNQFILFYVDKTNFNRMTA